MNGLKGLTPQDRASWEKQYQNEIKGLPKDKLDNAYHNYEYKRLFGDEGYEDFKKIPSSERGNYLNSKLNKQIDIPVLDTTSEEQNKVDSLGQDYQKDNIDSTSNQASYDNYYNRFNKWKGSYDEAWDQLSKVAYEVSPYFKKYAGSTYLPLDEESKVDLLARYNADIDIYGREEANIKLANRIQTTVSENQPLSDKLIYGIQGAGTTLSGSLISGAGAIAAVAASPINQLIHGGYDNDLNVLQNWGNDIMDNAISRYGNKVMSTGQFLNSEEESNPYEIVRTAEEVNGSIADNLFSVNTLPELISQSGFTIAAMLQGAGLAAVGNRVFNTVKAATMASKATATVTQLDKLNKSLQLLNKAQVGFNAFVVPGAVGSIEGAIEGLNTKLNFLENSKREIAEKQQSAIDEAMQYFYNNPETAKELGFDLNNPADEERLQNKIFESYQPAYEDALRKAERNGAIAGLNNFAFNSGINGFINVMLKNTMFGPSVREAVKRTKVGKLFTSSDFIEEGGKIVAKTTSKWKKGANILKEMFGEFGEEYSQNITDAFATGGAEVSLTNYLDHLYDGDAPDAINDSLSDNLGGAFAAAGKSAISKETILAGMYGALSQAIGTPTINRRALKEAGESKKSKALGVIRTFYRNPIIEGIHNQRHEEEIQKETADVINSWLEKEGNLDKYKNLTGSISWSNEAFTSAEDGDEFSHRNSKIGKLVNDAFMLEKIKDTSLYNSIMENYTSILNMEEGSEEAKNLEESTKVSLKDMKSNAQKMLDTFSKVQEASKDIEKSLGNSVDSEVKQALIFGKISMQDWKDRATKLEDELGKIEVEGGLNHSDEQKKSIAQLGSLNRYNLDKQKEDLQKINEKIQTFEKNKSVISDKQKEELKSLKKKSKLLEERYKLTKSAQDQFGTEDIVLSEKDIMSLTPQDRFAMLNPKNLNRYSKEQQDIITGLINKGTSDTSDFMNKIEDSSRINQAQETFLVEYNYALKNPESLDMVANYLKVKSYKENLDKKFNKLNGIDNISDFIKSLHEATKNSTEYEIKVLNNKLKDNAFYKKYIALSQTFEGIITQLENNEEFKNVDEDTKDGVLYVLSYLQDKGIDPSTEDYSAALLSNNGQDFKNYMESKKEELGEKGAISDITTILNTFNSLFDSFTKNKAATESITKPVEVSSTSSEESKPPKVVVAKDPNTDGTNVFSKPISLEESEKEQANSSKFEMPKSEEPKGPKDVIVDKFKTNSNEEVANSAEEGLAIVEKSSSIYDDVKGEVTKIIDNLGDSEYNTPADLSAAIMTVANQIQAKIEEGGDSNDKISSLLKQVASKMLVKSKSSKVESNKSKPTTSTEKNIRNNGMITTASVENHPQSVVGKASKNFKMNDFLRKGHITPKTPIMFVADPSIIEGVKQEMGEAYNEGDHLPIMAVVEDSNGPLTIGDKRYQPIGFMPRNSAESQGAARMNPIRTAGLKQQDGTLLKDKDGRVITTNGYVRANPPEHTKAGTPNTLLHTIMNNDMEVGDRDRMNNENLPIQERQTVYNKIKARMLSKIKKVNTDSKGNRIHLSYFTSNMKGGEQEFELFVATPQNSFSRTGKPMVQVLTEGTPEEILKANSRLNRYGKTLEEFFKKKPFSDDIRFKRDNEVLVPVGESISKLKALGESLTKELSNYITIPKGYEYVLTPTEEMLGDNRMYQLSITNGTNTIPLAKVTNGRMTDETKAATINNIFLDANTKGFRYEGTQPFAKWQVNYNDFNAKEGESEKAKKTRLGNINDIFDDNILESSRTSLKYSIRGIDINSPFKQDGEEVTPTKVVANSNNATQNKPINSPTITAADQVKTGTAEIDSETGTILQGNIPPQSSAVEKAKKVVNQIIEDSKSMKLSEDNSSYEDENGVKYARVTSIIDADESVDGRFDPNSPWALPSSNIGTGIDEFVRDFFAGNLKTKLVIKNLLSIPKRARENKDKINDTAKELKKLYKKEPIVINTGNTQFNIEQVEPSTDMLPYYRNNIIPLGVFRDYDAWMNLSHLPLNSHNLKFNNDGSVTFTGTISMKDNSDLGTTVKVTIKGKLLDDYLKAKEEAKKFRDEYKKTGFKDINEAARGVDAHASTAFAKLNRAFIGALKDDKVLNYPNATQTQWEAFASQLVGLKNYLDAQGLTVIPRDVVVSGTIKVTDKQGQVHDVPVAGTLDLLAYDDKGNFYIFDMKTNRSGIKGEKIKKYSRQLSMYQKFIENKYGIKVASLNIIPINVSYPTPLGFRDGKTKYEVESGNQLLANGKEYKDTKPVLEEVGTVPFTEVNVQYDKLTATEKQLIDGILPKEFKPAQSSTVEEAKEGYTQEMKDILAKAPRDSQGKLLAPNDKLSNLTERQYAQVRTKAFKIWFGDWTVAATGVDESVENSSSEKLSKVKYDTLSEYADNNTANGILIGILLDKYISESDIKEINFVKYGASGSYNAATKILNIPISKDTPLQVRRKIIAHELLHVATGKYCFAYENLKDGLEDYNVSDEFVSELPKLSKEQIEAFEELSNIKWQVINYINDNQNIVSEISKKYKDYQINIRYFMVDGNPYDLHEFLSEVFSNPALIELLTNIKSNKNNTSSLFKKFVQALSKIFGIDVSTTLFGDVVTELNKIIGKNHSNDVSKVVDENGEPLVVYHGSSNKFSIFDKNSKRRSTLTNILNKGFYFSNEHIAEQYSSSKEIQDFFKLQELRDGGYSMLEIAEAFGANIYDDDSMNKIAGYIYSLENKDFNFKENLYAVFLNIRNPIKYDLKGNVISHLSKEQRAAINSSEGAILYNVNETLSRYRGEITVAGMYVGTDYIVFNPNQIKSATDNIGTFSRDNNDIRDRKIPNISPDKLEVEKPATTVNSNLGMKMGKRKDFFAKPTKKSTSVTPSNNSWDLLDNDVRQSAIQLGYTKEAWNNMSEEEKKHQKKCLS